MVFKAAKLLLGVAAFALVGLTLFKAAPYVQKIGMGLQTLTTTGIDIITGIGGTAKISYCKTIGVFDPNCKDQGDNARGSGRDTQTGGSNEPITCECNPNIILPQGKSAIQECGFSDHHTQCMSHSIIDGACDCRLDCDCEYTYHRRDCEQRGGGLVGGQFIDGKLVTPYSCEFPQLDPNMQDELDEKLNDSTGNPNAAQECSDKNGIAIETMPGIVTCVPYEAPQVEELPALEIGRYCDSACVQVGNASGYLDQNQCKCETVTGMQAPDGFYVGDLIETFNTYGAGGLYRTPTFRI